MQYSNPCGERPHMKATSERNRDRDATKIYLKEVSHAPLLTHDQEKSLSQQIEQVKTEQVLSMLGLKACRQRFCELLNQALAGAPHVMLSVDADQELDEGLRVKLQQLHELIMQPLETAHTRDQIAECVRELPLQLKFLDECMQIIAPIMQQITASQGTFLRFALSQGITRDEFLNNYQNENPSNKWHTFVHAHEGQVQVFRQEIARLSDLMGVTPETLRDTHVHLRELQKRKAHVVEHMLRSNLRLVVSVAKRYINVSSTPLLDLVQEGNIGLLKAIEKYNWRLGFRFSTYATWWIKQCVLKALNEQHRIIRVPSHMTDLVKRVSRAREELMRDAGYEPSQEEIAAMLEIDVGAVNRVWTVAQGTISLETPIGAEDEQSLGHVIEDPNGMRAFEQISEVDAQNAVCDVLAELTPREERVIRMRFGIGMDRESTLEDVGHMFGVTRERVRQIESKALHKLKQPELARRLQEALE
jgi:RNA polymerase primary sigma factor